jgi:hypothetical protein
MSETIKLFDIVWAKHKNRKKTFSHKPVRKYFKIILIWNHWAFQQQTWMEWSIWWCSTKFMIFVSIRYPSWLPPQENYFSIGPIVIWLWHHLHLCTHIQYIYRTDIFMCRHMFFFNILAYIYVLYCITEYQIAEVPTNYYVMQDITWFFLYK